MRTVQVLTAGLAGRCELPGFYFVASPVPSPNMSRARLGILYLDILDIRDRDGAGPRRDNIKIFLDYLQLVSGCPPQAHNIEPRNE